MPAAKLGAVLALGASLAGAVPRPSEADLEQMWKRFQETYSRHYAEETEEPRRFLAFSQNIAKAQNMNLEQGINCTDLFDKSCVFGVTKFMDMFPDEFVATRLGYKRQQREHFDVASVLSLEGLEAAPQSVDWRQKGAVTKVKDQGQCGSCWAFSTTEEVESQVFIATGKLPVLSTQQIISCDKTDQGCNGGDTVTAYQYIKKVGGLDTAFDYPDKSHISGRTGTCTWDKEEVAKVTGFTYATTPCNSGACDDQDEDALAQVLASKGPVSICVNAADAGWQLYNSGIYSRKCSGASSDLDHCVQLVGYNKGGSTPYWIVRNSWNTDWGIDGYMHLEMGSNACGIADEATIVQVASGQESVVV